MKIKNDDHYMKLALKQAKKAYEIGEVPIGCVIVKDGKVISKSHNLREIKKKATAHAEIIAINKACKKLDSWRLIGCTLYVTLEPCAMCAGAIINSRIDRVVFGAHDYKAGSCGSLCNLFELDYNHKPLLTTGVREEECGGILSEFFRELRRKKAKKRA